MIFHIVNQKDWEKISDEMFYRPDSLIKEGFIHCSTLEKIPQVLSNFFMGQKDLILISINESKVFSDIIWEDLYGHDFEFPHIYGELNLDAVIKITLLKTDNDGRFIIPQDI